MKILLAVGLLFALCLVVSPVLAATITTDKPDYVPEQIVTISGTGFTLGNPVFITVTRPDGTTVPSVVPNPVNPDASGAFTVSYQLDGIQGTYVVVATDSTGLTARTVFNDSVIPPPIPEFPSMALPVGMIIGIIGFVSVIKLREK